MGGIRRRGSDRALRIGTPGDAVLSVGAVEASAPALVLDAPAELVAATEHAPGPPLRIIEDATRAGRSWRSVRRGSVITDAASATLVATAAALTGAVLSVPAIAVFMASWLALFGMFGLYPARLVGLAEEVRRIAGATAAGVLALVVLTAPTTSAIVAGSLTGFLSEAITRRAWRGHVARLRARGLLAERAVIVGTGQDAARIAHGLQVPGSGYVPLGFVATSGPLISPNGLTVLGSADRLEDVIRTCEADCVFIASRDVGDEELAPVLRSAHRAGAAIRVSTLVPPTRASRVTFEQSGPITSVGLVPVRLTRSQAALKRALDIVVASLGLVLSMPLWLVIAAAVKGTSAGPVLFRQRRVTKDGAVFTMLKFRTMVDDAERRIDLTDRAAPFFKVREDPRVTRIGKVLRTLSLDELPQLVNVLRGEMSMVGPRPLPVEQIEAHAERLAPRHEVRAGLTGWWQVNGRSDVDADEALGLDLYYIQNWSLGLDLTILWRTARAMLDRRGAV